MPSTSSRVTGSSVVASLLTDLTAALEEDGVEDSKGRGPKASVVSWLDSAINRSKSTVSNSRPLLVGSSLETAGSSIKVVEETITLFYSKGLLSYYRKSFLV